MVREFSYRDNEVTGNVRNVTTIIVDVHATVLPPSNDFDGETLYELRVNGRTVKRMNKWQARRLGIIPDKMDE